MFESAGAETAQIAQISPGPAAGRRGAVPARQPCKWRPVRRQGAEKLIAPVTLR